MLLRPCTIMLAALGSITAHAAAPSIEDFAARSRIEAATISPDGHYVALINTHDGQGAAVVIDLSPARAAPKVVLSEPPHFRLTWCRWATDTRLLCGYLAMFKPYGSVFGVTRLVAVDADGKNTKVLVQNSDTAQGQFQDRVINWNPGPANTVLIEADEGLTESQAAAGTHVYGNVGTHAAPAVFELNVVTGTLAMRQHAREPIRSWTTDSHGHVRLGWGLSGNTRSYYARLDGDSDWRRLAKFEAFSRENHFDPIAISSEDPNKAYAYANYEGRKALWLIDLTDKEDPTLVFSHPVVDAGSPILARDGRLLGVHYETEHPMIYYTDEPTRGVNAAAQQLTPGEFTSIIGSTRDEKTFVIRSYSDISPPTFRVLDMESHHAMLLGEAYPGRDASTLASMRSISFPARDGTLIPAYLSTPVGGPSTNLPLIVMPHGGPIARDTWSYFFLREFLVSRGYAVLQMNFRGSSGYGDDWFFAAHQDWGGLTYDDVVDGARWAIQRGIADPKRLGIVGWSFGGYIALLGAQRNADLFRCAVDIAGVSDLNLLIDEGHNYLNSRVRETQIGSDKVKLKLNSPLQHAADFNVPLLMLHGDMDAQVPFEQSEEMDRALTRAGKPHQFIRIPDGDHQFSAVKDRIVQLNAIDAFLGEHLAAH
jgi:dipeptidyl aminopeptidase/acylaminoacyl peptidase